MKKAFLVLLCLVLAGGLMYLLVNYKKAEIQEQERLEKLVTREKQKKTETTEKKQKKLRRKPRSRKQILYHRKHQYLQKLT